METQTNPAGKIEVYCGTCPWLFAAKSGTPSWETNCIDDWETKVEAVIDENPTREYERDFWNLPAGYRCILNASLSVRERKWVSSFQT
jgi:hypothetical protein